MDKKAMVESYKETMDSLRDDLTFVNTTESLSSAGKGTLVFNKTPTLEMLNKLPNEILDEVKYIHLPPQSPSIKTDITAEMNFSRFPNLQSIAVSDGLTRAMPINGIFDCKAVSGCKKLENINIDFNNLTNLDALPAATITLDANGKRVIDRSTGTLNMALYKDAKIKLPPEADILPPSETDRPQANKNIVTIKLEDNMVYEEFASMYGMTCERLNDLNSLDLAPETLLAKDSELYVPKQNVEAAREAAKSANEAEKARPAESKPTEPAPAAESSAAPITPIDTRQPVYELPDVDFSELHKKAKDGTIIVGRGSGVNDPKDAKLIQNVFINSGLMAQVPEDDKGHVGPKTDAAIKDLQNLVGLKDDGKISRLTLVAAEAFYNAGGKAAGDEAVMAAKLAIKNEVNELLTDKAYSKETAIRSINPDQLPDVAERLNRGLSTT